MRKLNWSLMGMGAVLFVAACSDSLSDSLSPSRLAPTGPSKVLHIQGAVNTNFYQGGTCTVINGNIYPDQFTVGVNGDPSVLTDPPYYIKVIEPGEGTVVELGASTGAVFNGTDACQQLWSLVFKTSDGSQGFDPTTNGGGEYQVVISKTADYPDGGRKSDNFKIRNYTPPEPPCDPETEECEPPCEENILHPCPVFSAFGVNKFYDANINGVKDGGEPFIQNWEVVVTVAGVTTTELTPFSTFVTNGDAYSVSENMPIQTNWYRTTQQGLGEYPVAGTAPIAEDILFGNVCTGAGNGRTIGFWSNKNGAAVLNSGSPTILSQVLALPLRKADGSLLGSPTLKNYQTWLLNASATNMAYMLSAQLAAMKGNTLKSPAVSLSALIYAPGTNSANALGFATVGDVMDEAIALLYNGGVSPLIILSDSPLRARAEALKTALDRANQDNSTSFVQPTPCTFTFAVASPA
jgi:hypothetical protein